MTARPHANHASKWLMQNKKYSLPGLKTAHELGTAVTEKGSPPDAPSLFKRKRAGLIKAHRNTDASLRRKVACQASNLQCTATSG